MDPRRLVWGYIRHAPAWPDGGERVGEATSAVTPWPHQVRAFHRLYDQWPPRLLIADEVGLGKTIQAGLLLRQAWLAGRARRILVLAPKAVLRQWQVELREKFNLNWPIYDGQRLCWYPSPGLQGDRRSARSDPRTGTASPAYWRPATYAAPGPGARSCCPGPSPGTWWCSTRPTMPAAPAVAWARTRGPTSSCA